MGHALVRLFINCGRQPFFVFIFIILIKFTFAQSIQSPDLFLGYPLGSQYTLHYKIVDYFKRITDAAPHKIKLESYGKTNEGRELFIAIASTNEFTLLNVAILVCVIYFSSDNQLFIFRTISIKIKYI